MTTPDYARAQKALEREAEEVANRYSIIVPRDRRRLVRLYALAAAGVALREASGNVKVGYGFDSDDERQPWLQAMAAMLAACDAYRALEEGTVRRSLSAHQALKGEHDD